MASKSGTIHLIEEAFSEAPKVDRAAKIIRNVKILGKQSKNNREYSDRALNEAAALYDGAPVNVDHPKRSTPDAERGMAEGIGVIRDPKVQADGVYGDLHYLDKHPLTEMTLERAERFPRTFGLSHNADGKVANFRGKTIVESVTRVRSVDLVSRPATNQGIFESEDTPVQTTIKAVLESVKDKKHWGVKGLAKLLEMDPMMAEAPMEAPPADEDADGQIDAAFKAAINKVLDEEGDIKAKLKRIKDILTAQEKIMSGGDTKESPAAPAEEADASESLKTLAAKEPGVKLLMEQVNTLTAERDASKAENAARALLESMDREASDLRVKALTLLPATDRKALVESWPKRQAQGGKPVRTIALTEADTGEYKPAETPKKWAALVR